MALSMGISRRDWGALSLGITAMMLFAAMGEGREFRVGDKNGWTQPNSANATTPSETYNQWAERHRFQIGDTLLFVYNKNEDSVIQVSEEDYRTCNGSKPMASYDDGRTAIKLMTSGPHYFISGVKERCQNSEKLVVVVLALRGAEPRSVAVAAPAPLEGFPSVVQGAPPTSGAPQHCAVLLQSAVSIGSMGLCVLLL